MGMGREELEQAILSLEAEKADVAAERDALGRLMARAEMDRQTLHETLSVTQAHCARQLDELRGWRASELAPLAARMAHARQAHPEGSDLTSLVSEVGEVARAMYAEAPDQARDRARDELLDVAAVTMRLYLGETKQREVTFASGPDGAP